MPKRSRDARASSRTPAAPPSLEAAKLASTGQLLMKCARLMDELAIARANRDARSRGANWPTLRPVHTKLFPHIDFAGTRIGTIAERLGVTKQAASQWIAELEEMKVVETIVDPEDARAKQVRFTGRGVEAIQYGLGVLRTIEDEIAARVGAKTMESLQRALREVLPVLSTLEAAVEAD